MSGRFGVLGGIRYTHQGHEVCHIFSLQYSSDCYLGESSHPNWCRGQRECLGSEEGVFGGWREGLGKFTYYSSQVRLTVRVNFLLFESACFRMGNSCRMVSCGRGKCSITMTSLHHDMLRRHQFNTPFHTGCLLHSIPSYVLFLSPSLYQVFLTPSSLSHPKYPSPSPCHG